MRYWTAICKKNRLICKQPGCKAAKCNSFTAMQPGFCTYEELKDYISSTKSQILESWEYRRLLDVRYILQRLTIRRALSILGLFRNRQKARKLGLLRPLPLQIIMKSTDYFTPVLCKSSRKSVILPRGKNLHFLQKGWGKTVDIILR